MRNLTKSKITERLTDDELSELICKLPLSTAWQERLDRLFDKIERHFMKTTEKPKTQG